jgi:VanZ family protein
LRSRPANRLRDSFHPARMRSSASRYAIILTGATIFIVYASLYPFDFGPRTNALEAIREVLSTWRLLDSWEHVVSNTLLYVPFGFCLVRALSSGSGFARFVLAGLAGFLLCACLEVAQVHDRTRDPSMSDVYANTAGAIVGAAVGVLALHGARRNARFERHPFSSLMLLCWLGNRLFPYQPSLSAMAATSTIPLDDLFRNLVNWLAVAVLLEAVFGNARSRWILPALAAVTLMARIVMAGAVLSPAEVAGAAVAVLIWAVWLWRFHARAMVVAVLFTASAILQALEPFTFLAVARPFGLVPFRSFMNSIENVVPVFFDKAFTYGTLVWLGIRAGIPFGAAVALGAVLELLLRLLQVYLPGRSAEITDAIMLLLLAAGLRLIGEDPLSEQA